MLDRIPRPLLVFLVIVLGVGFFFIAQEPHTVCSSQLPILKQSQAGFLFPKPTKTGSRAPVYSNVLSSCRNGNSAGACYEYFQLLRKLVRDLQASPQECLAPFGEVPEIQKALRDGPQMLVRLAWGDRPPEPGLARYGWLETPDLALYCQLKSSFVRVYGEETWDELRLATHQKLPGEAEKIQDGVCLNCEFIKKAPEVFSPEEIWNRSLFSLRCDQYN